MKPNTYSLKTFDITDTTLDDTVDEHGARAAKTDTTLDDTVDEHRALFEEIFGHYGLGRVRGDGEGAENALFEGIFGHDGLGRVRGDGVDEDTLFEGIFDDYGQDKVTDEEPPFEELFVGYGQGTDNDEDPPFEEIFVDYEQCTSSLFHIIFLFKATNPLHFISWSTHGSLAHATHLFCIV